MVFVADNKPLVLLYKANQLFCQTHTSTPENSFKAIKATTTLESFIELLQYFMEFIIM